MQYLIAAEKLTKLAGSVQDDFYMIEGPDLAVSALDDNRDLSLK